MQPLFARCGPHPNLLMMQESGMTEMLLADSELKQLVAESQTRSTRLMQFAECISSLCQRYEQVQLVLPSGAQPQSDSVAVLVAVCEPAFRCKFTVQLWCSPLSMDAISPMGTSVLDATVECPFPHSACFFLCVCALCSCVLVVGRR